MNNRVSIMDIKKISKGAKILFKRYRRDKPRISIIMPTLNEEKYIKEALDSIEAQKNVPEYELVIADGGSKDQTLKIAKKYADVIVYEPKRTVGAGRNTGMYASAGSILVCANADTYYPKNWLYNVTKPFANKKVVGTIGKVLPKDGDIIDNLFAHIILHPAAYILSKVKMHYVDSSNMAVRRDSFMKIGGIDLSLVSGEDTELLKRLNKHGEIVYEPKAVAYISMRRVKKWGKIYYTYFHTTNFFKTHLLNKGHNHYEPIRE